MLCLTLLPSNTRSILQCSGHTSFWLDPIWSHTAEGVMTNFPAQMRGRVCARFCACVKSHCAPALSPSRLTWPERHLGQPGWCVPVVPTVSPGGQKPAAVWVGQPAGPGPPGSAVPLRCFPLWRSESRMAGKEPLHNNNNNNKTRVKKAWIVQKNSLECKWSCLAFPL